MSVQPNSITVNSCVLTPSVDSPVNVLLASPNIIQPVLVNKHKQNMNILHTHKCCNNKCSLNSCLCIPRLNEPDGGMTSQIQLTPYTPCPMHTQFVLSQCNFLKYLQARPIKDPSSILLSNLYKFSLRVNVL